MDNNDLIELKIDEGFKNLIRPLYKQEYLQLEANLLADGCRNPITVWNGVIIDGHNRYEICRKHNIPFDVEEMSFESREEVVAWICANQLGRRNLTEETRKFLIGKQYQSEKIVNERKNASGNNQYYSPPDNSLPNEDTDTECGHNTKRKTAERIAEQNHISHATVEKYGIYSKALDTIAEKEPKLVSKILSGRYKISHENLVQLAKMNEKDIKGINKRLENTSQPFAKYNTTRNEIQNAYKNNQPFPGPSVKDMPKYDPDAEITGLTLTIPSWISSIERVSKESDSEKITSEAKCKLRDALFDLRRTVNSMLRNIGGYL